MNQILYSLENNNHIYFVVTFIPFHSELRVLISEIKLNCI